MLIAEDFCFDPFQLGHVNDLSEKTMVMDRRSNIRGAPFQNISLPPPTHQTSEIRGQPSKRKMVLEIDRQTCFAHLTRAGGLLILTSSDKSGDSELTVSRWGFYYSFVKSNQKILYIIAQCLETRGFAAGAPRGRPGGRNRSRVDTMLIALQVQPIIFVLRVLTLIHLEWPLWS